MSLGDPHWELIDPTPNVHALFVQFDKTFFWCKLASRAIVRWSKRMYSCAGVCSYEGRGGVCDVALSEPLLKLRPRKDLVETLLHEMIHAYLFITGGDRDRDGHGPIFQSHMHRINKQAGLNISIYHDFHDEVKLYKTHWWRCNGPCQQRKPFFGIVKRSSNRAPGPNDFWWDEHKRHCGGTFIKIKEPEKKVRKNVVVKKAMGDITKFYNNTTGLSNTAPSKNINTKSTPNLKTLSDISGKTQGVKSNGGNTVVVTQKNNNNNNKGCPCNSNSPKKPESSYKNIPLWEGKGHIINNKRRSTITIGSEAETVRNVWANKQIGLNSLNNNNEKISKKNNKRNSVHVMDTSPPCKMKKIDDYFNTSISPKRPVTKDSATSILQEIYGSSFVVHQTEQPGSKMVAIKDPEADTVDCPICNTKVVNININSHLDECLNRAEIEKLCNKGDVGCDAVNIDTGKSEIDKEIKVSSIEKNTGSYSNIKTNANKVFTTVDPKPSTSRENDVDIIDLTNLEVPQQKCPCCAKNIDVTIEEHLEECLSFMNDSTEFNEGTTMNTERDQSLDDNDNEDDIMDESLIFNETGTKYPCPCCLNMVEQVDMNEHLDGCLK